MGGDGGTPPFSRVTPRHAYAGMVSGRMYSSNPFASLALEGSGWSAPCCGRLRPGKDPELIVRVLVGLGAGLDRHENSCPNHDLIHGLSSA